MNCYLFGSFTPDELLVDAVGSGHQLFGRLERLEVFTRRPKLDVLLAELRLQEDTEGSFSICERRKTSVRAAAWM